ncbi:MAG: class I SAM-dependent DNA methyltransferase, partial [Rhodanobacteraceae bacterium]
SWPGQCIVIRETILSTEAQQAYQAVAPAYDVLTGGYAHERWLAGLEALAFEHGLVGHRLLDVACGTGASFLPMLTRRYAVTGCDISTAMLARARLKAPQARLHLADMRRLPILGEFDLVTCLDDALNYVLDEEELEATLCGFARNLAPGGIAIWDLNTLAQYRGQFARDQVIARDDVFIGWSAGSASSETHPGDLVEIRIDVFAPTVGENWHRSSSVHRQRHWPRSRVEALTHVAGLELVDIRGQHPGGVIGDQLDELAHTKAIYVACAR